MQNFNREIYIQITKTIKLFYLQAFIMLEMCQESAVLSSYEILFLFLFFCGIPQKVGEGLEPGKPLKPLTGDLSPKMYGGSV